MNGQYVDLIAQNIFYAPRINNCLQPLIPLKIQLQIPP